MDINKKRVMLFRPMGGKAIEEVVATRNRAINALTGMGYDIANIYFTVEGYSPEDMSERGIVHIPLDLLTKALDKLSKCHVAYFCNGWQDSRGCKILHEIAEKYGLEIIYEQ